MSNPYPVNVIFVGCNEPDRKVEIASTAELVKTFSLHDNGPWIANEISENANGGTVYCALCPHAEEVRDARSPIFAPTEQALEALYQQAREDI